MNNSDRALDILVAQSVFGFKFVESDTLRHAEDGVSGDWIEEKAPRIQFCFHETNGDLERAPFKENTPDGDWGEDDLPYYSENPEDMFEILNHFGYFKMGSTTVGNMAIDMYFCELFNGKEFVTAVGTSIGQAVCLAALKTKEPIK